MRVSITSEERRIVVSMSKAEGVKLLQLMHDLNYNLFTKYLSSQIFAELLSAVHSGINSLDSKGGD